MADHVRSETGGLPFDVVTLDHVVLRARDLPRLVAFYRDVIGCPVVRERPELGLVHLAAGTSLIDILAIDGTLGQAGVSEPAGYGRNVDHLCLRISPFDFAALQAHFARHDIRIDPPAERFGAAGQGLSVYLADPEGNGIELKA